MKKRNGFTLVELLAVVVILGIIMMISIPAVTRWIDRSKTESKDSIKHTLVMATQSYAQANKDVLPKVIGQTVTISAESLQDNQYLKEELQDANKNSCMSSYVKVYKSDKNKYTYTPYVICEGDSAPKETPAVTPNISIGFSGNKAGDNIQTVATSSFKATISGGKKDGKDLGIDGYSYSISVKYTNDVNEKSVEIYNSGSLNGGGNPSLIIEKSLGDYTDITKVNEFIVTVKAYNSDGGYKEQTASSLYKDTTPPTCGTISGQADVDSWIKQKGKTRTVSVLCNDNEDGSGCVKDKYTQTFDTEMENGIISIYDNAGNKTDCSVRVHIDWTAPSFTATAYKNSGNLDAPGERVSDPVTVSHSTANHTYTMSSNYRGTVNGWLNAANFPRGITYVINTEDNIHLNDGKLYYNKGGIWSEGAQYNALQNGTTKIFSATDKTFKFSIEEEGLRKEKYVVRDKAGNEVTMYFLAKIDRTNPRITINKSNLNTESGVTFTVSCTDYESKCASGMGTHTGIKSNQTYTVTDNAGNSKSGTGVVTSFDCHPYQVACGTYVCGTCSWELVKCYGSPNYVGTGLVPRVEGNISIGCTQCANGFNCHNSTWECCKLKFTCPRCTAYCTRYKTCYR